MSHYVARIFRFVLKLVFGLSAAAVAVGFLLVAVILIVFTLLKTLVTGRKPVSARAFTRFHKFSRPGLWPGSRPFSDKSKASSGQIVDIEAHEVKDTGRQP